MGLTSVPGYIRSMGTNGVLPTMSAGFKEQWHSMSPGWKALMIGAPAAEVVHAVKTPDEEGGPGKAERVAKGLAGAVAGATMGGIPMTTGNLLQHGLGRAAGAAGRVVDRYKKPVGELTADATHGQVVPSERYVTERAGGIHPEVTG
jgi:hypothetical protein